MDMDVDTDMDVDVVVWTWAVSMNNRVNELVSKMAKNEETMSDLTKGIDVRMTEVEKKMSETT